jgi:hypothetical protein
MKELKNIDRLFQEKFKDFEVAPPEMAWENIEAKLNNKKKKRRVIPFWFKPVGIAASLLVGFYTFMYLNENTKIDSKENKNTIESNKDAENGSSGTTKVEDVLIVPNNSTVTNNESLESLEKNDNLNVKVNSVESLSEKNNTKNGLNPFNKNNIVISDNASKKDKNKSNNNKSIFEKNIVSKDVLSNTNESNKSIKEDPFNNSSLVTNNNKSDLNTPLNQIKNNSNRSVIINEKFESNITQDSSIVAQISDEVKALEQLLKEKEVGKNVEEKEKESKWGVSTNAAPVYFNSATNGSPINTQFAENSKSYASTLSYGVGINYAISKKLSLRTGVNALSLEYNTNDVSYTTTMKGVTNDGSMLSRNTNGQTVVFVDQTTMSTLSSDVENFVQNNTGRLNQITSYYEIPVELSYKLIDKKFGLEFIGGMSSLFLNQNSISLLSNGLEMEIGQANNLNRVHFSSNVGIGLKYSFLKSLEVNFNPMFKYQLNTYTDNAGNFKPYFIGLYSGLSYKF